MGDLGVVEYFLGLIEDSAGKLDVAVKTNNIEDAEQIKKVIFNLSKKINEELS